MRDKSSPGRENCRLFVFFQETNHQHNQNPNSAQACQDKPDSLSIREGALKDGGDRRFGRVGRGVWDGMGVRDGRSCVGCGVMRVGVGVNVRVAVAGFARRMIRIWPA
jgi:hypothetical protein